jgi:hypothetical protein
MIFDDVSASSAMFVRLPGGLGARCFEASDAGRALLP